jgi:signal transduction histidine kinase
LPANVSAEAHEAEYIKFTIDAELLRELGERLVGKPYVALGELVKNAYDADATRCTIRFGEDQIEVIDDGNGMTHDEFVGKWMRIGSTHKRSEQLSPRLQRPLTGSKGVGRLSAQFLGATIDVTTVARGKISPAVVANLDWNETYEKSSLVEAGAWVHAAERSGALPDGAKYGTAIRINGLKDTWTTQLLMELATELWFLQPPPILAEDVSKREQFKVVLEGVDELDALLFEQQTTKALENWIARIEGEIADGCSSGIAKVRVTFRNGESYDGKCKLPHHALDKAKFGIFIFRLSGRQASGISVDDARDYFKKFGGLHIYDTDFRLPYYGGDERDWLGLEMAHSHRLIVSQLVPEELRSPNSTLQDLPTLGRVLGVVKVSTPHEQRAHRRNASPSELLQVQITRDKLIENRAYEDLVYFVRWAFDFYSYRSTARRAIELAGNIPPPALQPTVQLDLIRQHVATLASKVPAQLVRPLESALDQFKEAELQRQKSIDAERVLLGALATAGMGSLALQHELAKELNALERLVRQLESQAGADERGGIKDAVTALKNWVDMASQTRKMFAPFFDEVDREKMKRVRVGRVIDRLASNLSPLLRGVKVETDELPDDLRLPQGTLAGWNAVFQNVFVNAVNAMLDSRVKRIRCRADLSGRRAILIVEDTGVGADLNAAEEYFKPFVRKLDLPEDRRALGLGGMGIGLTIVRMVCQTFGCNVRFARPKSPFKTALEISWEN